MAKDKHIFYRVTDSCGYLKTRDTETLAEAREIKERYVPKTRGTVRIHEVYDYASGVRRKGKEVE
jgi:hypothetical protein